MEGRGAPLYKAGFKSLSQKYINSLFHYNAAFPQGTKHITPQKIYSRAAQCMLTQCLFEHATNH